jgi:APA family basic amino acid/polyamine antiporter
MTQLSSNQRLTKQLTLFDVYALACGATLSAGLFLLPGLAAQEAGAAIVLCYALAAVPLVPAMLSIVELSTAMPRAGGAYYFLDRALGPLAGTVGGIGTWLALVLKAAFALVGMGVYLHLFAPDLPMVPIACGFAIVFGLLNMRGADITGKVQVLFVMGLLLILGWFCGKGVISIDASHFDGFVQAGGSAILATTGTVYISYVGVTKVASVAEEVRNPERNLPLGVILALGTAFVAYLLCTSILVGVIPMDALTGADGSEKHLSPMAEAASIFAGHAGKVVISIAALLAFASVANAAVLSSSRYPLAMARDHLLPSRFRRLSAHGMPIISIVVTVGAILICLLLFDPLRIAKLASAFQLMIFALLCLAVIVMRESRIESYDPGFKSPLYPWMQIVGMLAAVVLVLEMGWLPSAFTGGMIAVGVGWYYVYARKRVARHGAVYHVFARLGQRRFEALDVELRGILKEKGLRAQDPFDQVVARALVLDLQDEDNFEQIVDRVAHDLSTRLSCQAATLARGFLEGTRTGATPVSGGAALPHLRMPGIEVPQLAMVRVASAVDIQPGDPFGAATEAHAVHALFFLVSPEADPGQHLRLLAELASHIDQDHFLDEWLTANDELGLKETLLRHERHLSLTIDAQRATASLIDQPIHDLNLPRGCLVAIIHRGGDTIVPRGSTMVREGDRLTIIGDEADIAALAGRFPRSIDENF